MRKHFAIAVIVAVLAGPGVREVATAEPQAGEVLALFGQCFVETAGRRNALKLGDAVHIGDSLDVAAGAKLKLRMSDGSVIAVASGTRFAIADYGVVARLPASFFHPVFYMKLFERMPSPEVATVLQICGIVAALLAAAGLALRLSLPLAVVCSLVLNGMLNSAGRVIVGSVAPFFPV